MEKSCDFGPILHRSAKMTLPFILILTPVLLRARSRASDSGAAWPEWAAQTTPLCAHSSSTPSHPEQEGPTALPQRISQRRPHQVEESRDASGDLSLTSPMVMSRRTRNVAAQSQTPERGRPIARPQPLGSRTGGRWPVRTFRMDLSGGRLSGQYASLAELKAGLRAATRQMSWATEFDNGPVAHNMVAVGSNVFLKARRG